VTVEQFVESCKIRGPGLSKDIKAGRVVCDWLTLITSDLSGNDELGVCETSRSLRPQWNTRLCREDGQQSGIFGGPQNTQVWRPYQDAETGTFLARQSKLEIVRREPRPEPGGKISEEDPSYSRSLQDADANVCAEEACRTWASLGQILTDREVNFLRISQP